MRTNTNAVRSLREESGVAVERKFNRLPQGSHLQSVSEGPQEQENHSQTMLEKGSQTKHVTTRAWTSFDEPSNHDQQRWLTASL
jgi:hypothetical protein